MSAFNHINHLNDAALKPLLLQSLLTHHLPLPDDQTQTQTQTPTPTLLPFIFSTLKLHHLLSSPSPSSPHHSDLITTFINRISHLASSPSPHHCWVGVSLIGFTCSQCDPTSFLCSYSNVFDLLLTRIQMSGVSNFVKVASFAALSDLITRLGGFSNVKKDGASHAGKLVPVILKTLNEDTDEAMLDAATQLLSTILIYFPSPLVRYHDNIEGAIASRVMCGRCNVNLSKKLAFCLALLPKSKGDEGSWSLMMQKILLSLSGLLNDALEGLEDESRRDEAVSLLVPPGKDRPPSLGGQIMAGEALRKGDSSHQSLVSSISILVRSCCALLTLSYPVQVSVPVRPLLAVIRRVLTVDGSLPESLQPFTTAMQQESVCSQLPFLHLNALEVLAALVKGIRSQLLPYAADVVHILMGYFKKCQIPELRTKAYSIVRVLLFSMGAGMSLHIFGDVVNNGYNDLTFGDTGINGGPINEETMGEAISQRKTKKRKHGSAGGLMEQNPPSGSEIKAVEECPASTALKVAAVEALEALLVVGGSLKSDGWRRRLDHLLVQVAKDACIGFCSDHGNPNHPKETRSTSEEFQLVALRALLASLLSPADVRPPHLAQGLELFKKGKRGTGSKVTEFCAQALLSLEVLVHPRALPLIDVSLQYGNNHYLGRTDLGGLKYKSPNADAKFGTTGYGNPHDVYDFLNDLYLENGSGSEDPAAEGAKSIDIDENSGDISSRKELEEPNVINGQSNEMITDKDDVGHAAANHVIQTEADGDRGKLNHKHHQEPGEISQELGSLPRVSNDLTPGEKSSDLDASESKDFTASRGFTPSAGVGSVVTTQADNDTAKLSVVQQDNESSDSFPDIVDADPDTDSD